MNKHYKYLFLSMSCNDPFFEISRRVVHDTWARDLIAGKYPDCTFYSYTSSPYERIENNCVYVNKPDDINHTYIKTVRALQMLRESGITWDVVVRTNTSTFINVEYYLEWVKQFDHDGLWGFMPGDVDIPQANTRIPFPVGWMMLLPGRYTDALIDHIDELNEESKYIEWIQPYLDQGILIRADDVLFGLFALALKVDYGINVELMNFPRKYVAHFRTTLKNHFLQPPLHESYNDPNEYYDKAEDILKLPFIQLRKFSVPHHLRFIECEEMYELQETIDKQHETL